MFCCKMKKTGTIENSFDKIDNRFLEINKILNDLNQSKALLQKTSYLTSSNHNICPTTTNVNHAQATPCNGISVRIVEKSDLNKDADSRDSDFASTGSNLNQFYSESVLSNRHSFANEPACGQTLTYENEYERPGMFIKREFDVIKNDLDRAENENMELRR